MATIVNTSIAPKSKPETRKTKWLRYSNQWASPTCLTSTKPSTFANIVPATSPIKIAMDFKNPFVNLCKIRIMTKVAPPKIKF